MLSTTLSCSARKVCRLMGAATLLTLALILLAGCAPGGQEEATAGIGGVFVGQASGADPLIAVIADEPESSGAERRVRAYVCDGWPDGVVEWFTGQVAGNSIDLTSIDGDAQFQAELSDEGAAGMSTLNDGTTLNFATPAAYDGAGLYDVTNNPDERFSGTSTSGETIEGFHTEENGTRIIENTITLTNGEQIRYQSEALFEGSGPPGTYFLIVLPNGEREAGRNVMRTAEGTVSGFGEQAYLTQSR